MTSPKELLDWAVDQGLTAPSEDGLGPFQEIDLVSLSQHGRGDVTASGDTVLYQLTIAGAHTLNIKASGIRRERTGVHAKLEIILNGVVLSWSNINIERHEDRQRLANKAHGKIGKTVGQYYQKELLGHDLDIYCNELWGHFIGASLPQGLQGNPDLELRSLLRPYIVDGGGTIFFAPPGRGKSYTLMLMAVSIDAGICDIWPVSQVKVLFINLERSAASIQRRLGHVNSALGLSPDRELFGLNARGKCLADIMDIVAVAVEKEGIGVIFLDSISRAGMGSLTEDRPVNATIDVLNKLAPSWCGVAHTPRQDESHIYGGIHFEAGADVVVKLTSERQAEKLGVGLEVTKENDLGPTDRQLFVYEFDRFGLYAVRDARKGEFVELEKGKQSILNQVEDYLLEHGKATATVIAKELELNRANVSEVLNNSERFHRFAGGGGRQGVLFGVKAPDEIQ